MAFILSCRARAGPARVYSVKIFHRRCPPAGSDRDIQYYRGSSRRGVDAVEKRRKRPAAAQKPGGNRSGNAAGKDSACPPFPQSARLTHPVHVESTSLSTAPCGWPPGAGEALFGGTAVDGRSKPPRPTSAFSGPRSRRQSAGRPRSSCRSCRTRSWRWCGRCGRTGTQSAYTAGSACGGTGTWRSAAA